MVQFWRSKSRDSIVLKNMTASFVLKGGSLLVGLATLPAFMSFFDDERVLGVWFTLIATLSWVLNFDVGIGNGARNRLATALAIEDRRLGKRIISSTYVATTMIVLVVGVLVLVAVAAVDWNVVFNIPAEVVPPDQLRSAVFVILGGLLAQLLLRTISSILYALQASAIVSAMSLVTSVALLVYALLGSRGMGGAGLLVLAQVYAISVNVPLLVASVLVFGFVLKDQRPNVKWFSMTDARDVVALGGQFFALQILYMLIANANPFLISLLANPARVVEYQIYYRPFNAVSSVFILVLTPIWSAVTQAVAARDMDWVVRTYRRLQYASVAIALALFACVPLLQFFVDVWLREDAIRVSIVSAFAFALSAGAFAWSGALSTIANGVERLRVQAIFFSIGLVLKLVFAWILTSLTGDWIWVVVSDIVALLPYIIAQPISLRRFISGNLACGKSKDLGPT